MIVPCAGDQSYLLRDHQAGTGIVFVDRPPRFMPGDAVLSDNLGGARAAVEHLIAAGHRRIAFLGDRLSVFTAIERRAATTRRSTRPAPRMPELERPSSPTAQPAQQAVLELLGLPDPPTALFTGQNLITIGAIRALRELGRQRQVALVGFDDVVLGDLVEPGVTRRGPGPVRARPPRRGAAVRARHRAAVGRRADAADRARVGRDPAPV